MIQTLNVSVEQFRFGPSDVDVTVPKLDAAAEMLNTPTRQLFARIETEAVFAAE